MKARPMIFCLFVVPVLWCISVWIAYERGFNNGVHDEQRNWVVAFEAHEAESSDCSTEAVGFTDPRTFQPVTTKPLLVAHPSNRHPWIQPTPRLREKLSRNSIASSAVFPP